MNIDYIAKDQIYVNGVLEGEYYADVKQIFQIMEGSRLQIKETLQTPHRKNTKKTTPRHIIARLLKTKGKQKIFKSS